MKWTQTSPTHTQPSAAGSAVLEDVTLAASRFTASSLFRRSSGVLGQLLDCRVLVLLDGGVTCGGWLRGNSEPPPTHVN